MVKEFGLYEENELPKCKRCKERTSVLVGKEKLCIDCASRSELLKKIIENWLFQNKPFIIMKNGK